MTIQIGDIQEVVFRSITMKGISVEDIRQLYNNFNGGVMAWDMDFTLPNTKFDALEEIINVDWTEYRLNHDHSFVFSKEFMLAVRPWLSDDASVNLNEIYFIQGAGY